MAEGDVIAYNDVKEQLMLGTHNWANAGHTIQITLHTGYSPDIDAHQVWLDTGVSTTEYGSGTGYTAGGKVAANQSVTQDNTNDRSLFDFDDVTWTALGALSPATPSHALVWNNTPSSPADPLMCYVILGTTATNGQDYTLQLSTSPSALISIT